MKLELHKVLRLANRTPICDVNEMVREFGVGSYLSDDGYYTA